MPKDIGPSKVCLSRFIYFYLCVPLLRFLANISYSLSPDILPRSLIEDCGKLRARAFFESGGSHHTMAPVKWVKAKRDFKCKKNLKKKKRKVGGSTSKSYLLLSLMNGGPKDLFVIKQILRTIKELKAQSTVPFG